MLQLLLFSVVLIHRVLVVSSFGKLLAIPVIIWGQTFGDLYLPLTKVLTFTSNLTAIKGTKMLLVTFTNVIWYSEHYINVVWYLEYNLM